MKGFAPATLLVPERDTPKAPSSYDAWEMRRRFFRLEEGDNKAAAEFLSSVGLFDEPDMAMRLAIAAVEGPPREARARILRLMRMRGESIHGLDGAHRVYADAAVALFATEFWNFRRTMLEEMKPKVSAALASSDYGVRFAALIRLGPSAVITALAFKDAVTASIRIDQLRKAKFQTCQRPDCGTLFAAVGPRARKFCSWYCGHIQAVRKSRKNL
jgi:hypothetical protein